MYTARLVRTWYHLVKGFLDWSQCPGRRVLMMELMVTCLWPKWSFNLKDIDYNLSWRGIDSDRSTSPRYIALQPSTQIYEGNWLGFQFHRDSPATPSHRTDDDKSLKEYHQICFKINFVVYSTVHFPMLNSWIRPSFSQIKDEVK